MFYSKISSDILFKFFYSRGIGKHSTSYNFFIFSNQFLRIWQSWLGYRDCLIKCGLIFFLHLLPLSQKINIFSNEPILILLPQPLTNLYIIIFRIIYI